MAASARDLGLQSLWLAFEPFQHHIEPPDRLFLWRGLHRHLTRVPYRGRSSLVAGMILVLSDDARLQHLVATVRGGAKAEIIEADRNHETIEVYPLDVQRRVAATFIVPGVIY